MNIAPTPTPLSKTPPSASALFPRSIPPPQTPEPEACAVGGARQLSRWEDLEDTWSSEERDLSHSGINE
jgi:hypothetical protein